MTDKLTVEAFFGDGKYTFRLTAPLIIEWERVTGVGIGGFAKRLFGNDYHLQEVSELIRLALIGGGTKPERAKQLIEAYALPIINNLPTALAIIEAAFFGADEPAPNKDKT